MSFLKRYVTLIAGGRCHLVHLVLIALLGLLAYSNTFNAPFQFDEEVFIEENPIVKDLNYFLEPSSAGEFELYDALKSRYIGYLTFALNYRIHGLDVTGYHIFNLAIHILNSLLVYLLVMFTLKTPFTKESSLKEYSEYIALCTGLLFVSHPIQTQAVTYVYQRLASLVAFFYLLSLVSYIKWRLKGEAQGFLNLKSLTFYLISLISTVLAMKTKENAFALPVVIALYEFMFFRDTLKRRTAYLLPFLLTMSIIPLTVLNMDRPFGEAIWEATKTQDVIPRGDYLLTQPRVIVTYLRLLLVPVNQNLIYDYPVFSSFFNPQVFLSFLFLLCLFSLLVYLHRRSQKTEAGLRLVAFGGLWFFITLSVESSLITLVHVIYEHRVYLPSAGVFLAVISGAFLLMGRLRNKRIKTLAVLSFILILLVLSYATYARNTVWGSEIRLWEDTASKSPQKAIAHYNLGVVYHESGLIDKAIEQYEITLRLKPEYAEAHNNLGYAYQYKGLIDRAIEHYLIAVRLDPDYVLAHNNLGYAYQYKGLIDKAIEHYLIAVKLDPDNIEAHYNLGLIYLGKEDAGMARREFETVLQIDPYHYQAGLFLNYISNPK